MSDRNNFAIPPHIFLNPYDTFAGCTLWGPVHPRQPPSVRTTLGSFIVKNHTLFSNIAFQFFKKNCSSCARQHLPKPRTLDNHQEPAEDPQLAIDCDTPFVSYVIPSHPATFVKPWTKLYFYSEGGNCVSMRCELRVLQ